MPKDADPAEVRAAVEAVLPWLTADPDAVETGPADSTGGAVGSVAKPERAVLALAVRLSLRVLPQIAPGHTVEVRVPPFAAVQCIAGPRHTRGTPPNVVETDPRTWLLLATGRLDWARALADGRIKASGSRADIAALLPVLRF